MLLNWHCRHIDLWAESCGACDGQLEPETGWSGTVEASASDWQSGGNVETSARRVYGYGRDRGAACATDQRLLVKAADAVKLWLHLPRFCVLPISAT